MPSVDLALQPSKASGPRTKAASVLKTMEEFCLSQDAGAVMPTRAEWMSRLNASDRAVRWALDELQRQGKIVRRQGSGTYVAERVPATDREPAWNLISTPVRGLTAKKTVSVIAMPDHAIFDRAIELLYSQVSDDLSLVCLPYEPRLGNESAQFEPSGEDSLGYILFRRDFIPLARSLQNAGHRVVLIGSMDAGEAAGVPNIYCDSQKGGYLAAQHLLELGHRKLGFLGQDRSVKTRRWHGQQKAVDEARKRGVEVEVVYFTPEQVRDWRLNPQDASDYFSRPQAPTGVLAWNDYEAAQLLSLLTSIGLNVPNDISIVGHDNLPLGQLLYPQLTTVDIAIEQQLQAALELLTLPEPPPIAHTTVALPTLIRRDSSARVAR